MIVSYAQNAEDVVLSRVFAGRRDGCYVDVGAAHPMIHSVTKHFYDLGWRGLNIEPHPRFAELLAAHRTDDINLAIGIAAEPGPRELFVGLAEYAGWTTFVADVAQRLIGRGCRTESVAVPVLPLTSVLAEHLGSREIDFLKVDAEGMEREILLSNDWDRFRPRVVVVEAIDPVDYTPTDDEWAGILVDAGYQRALNDGVNLFFAASGDDQALAALHTPANVLDDWVHAPVVEREAELRIELWGARDRMSRLDRELRELRAAIDARDVRLRQVTDALVAECARRGELEAIAADREAIVGTRWWRLGRLPRRVRGLMR